MACCLSGGGSQRGMRVQQSNQNKAPSSGSRAARGSLISPLPRIYKFAGRLVRTRRTDNDKIPQPNEIMRRVGGAGAEDAGIAGQECVRKTDGERGCRAAGMVRSPAGDTQETAGEAAQGGARSRRLTNI